MTDDLPDHPAAEDLRASDADRERVAEQLRDAVAEGRLDMEEFQERLEATYKARTYGELAPITRDLPGAGTVAPPTVVPDPAVSLVKRPEGELSWADRITGGESTSTWGVAVMSGFERKGRWTVPKRFDCFAFWGGGELDLRDAYFAEREVTINVVAIMGGVNVVVPPGVEVVVRGIGVMGGFDHGEEGVPGDPGAPRVIITGFAFWGGVGVERKVPKAERQRLKEARRQERREARRELHSSRRDQLHDLHDAHREAMREHREALREERERRRGGDR
ncbi:DUF1707 SHOCT-like domain-containing protein [Streptomyces sp. NPDC002643]